MTPLVTTAQLRHAVEDTLKLWLPWALAEACAANDLPRDHLTVPDDDAWHELHDVEELITAAAKIPAGAVVIPDEEYADTRRHQGRYQIIVGVVTRGVGFDDTVTVNDLYRAAIRMVLVQQPSLGGFAGDTRVRRSNYRPVAGDVARTLLYGRVYADTRVDDITPPAHEAPGEPPDPMQGMPPWTVPTDLELSVDPQERS
ncbi:hypothetical protein [Euzebya rosea]|uniref:hypothetical protein n=1 Tax=Euzebya rosea TaxID=2052804 RepID=UPI000D3E0566|nr:hypothetical protein [Euzebya rosea]